MKLIKAPKKPILTDVILHAVISIKKRGFHHLEVDDIDNPSEYSKVDSMDHKV